MIASDNILALNYQQAIISTNTDLFEPQNVSF